MSRRYFPLFWDTSTGVALIVGGGENAVRKVRLLCNAGARIHVIAPHVNDEISALFEEERLTWSKRVVNETDFQKAALVIAATGVADIDEFCSNAAFAAGVKINVVDRPELSDFIIPSIVDRSPVTVAISTAGTAPVLGKRIRAQLEASLPPNLGKLADFAAGLRTKVRETLGSSGKRRAFWECFFDGAAAEKALNGDFTAAQKDAEREITEYVENKLTGRAVYIDASLEAADLVSLRALRLLQQADAIVYDADINDEILNLARRDADRIRVRATARKASHKTIRKSKHSEFGIDRASVIGALKTTTKSGFLVVRLTAVSDSNTLFRHEINALNELGVSVDIVPSVSNERTGLTCSTYIPHAA